MRRADHEEEYSTSGRTSGGGILKNLYSTYIKLWPPALYRQLLGKFVSNDRLCRTPILPSSNTLDCISTLFLPYSKYLPGIAVRLGEHNWQQNDTEHPHQEFYIQEKIVPEGYIAASFTNDIALLWLDGAVKLNSYIRTITLATEDAAFFGGTGKVAGWGRTAHKIHEASPELKEMHVHGIYAKCKYFFSKGVQFEGPCAGDSGGPLTVQSGRDVLQIGIFISHNPVHDSDASANYTRVTSHLWWIKNEISRRTNCP